MPGWLTGVKQARQGASTQDLDHQLEQLGMGCRMPHMRYMPLGPPQLPAHLGFCRDATKSLMSSKPWSFSPRPVRPAASGLVLRCTSAVSLWAAPTAGCGSATRPRTQDLQLLGRVRTLLLGARHRLLCLLVRAVEDGDGEALVGHVQGQVLRAVCGAEHCCRPAGVGGHAVLGWPGCVGACQGRPTGAMTDASPLT